MEGLATTSALGISADNFLNGQLKTFQAAIYPQGKLPGATLTLPVGPPNFSRSNRYHEFALYAQDSWKVLPRLTVNLGVRYEYYGVQHNKDPKLDSNYYDGSGSTVFDQIRAGSIQLAPNSPIGSLWKPSKNNWAPRVGFAWDIFGDGKTSFRGGYGIAYERNFGNVTFNVIQNPPNYAVISLQAPADIASIPVTTSNAGPLAGSTGTKVFPKSSLRNVFPNIQQAYAHIYSASLEHQFSEGMLVAFEYSGSSGEDLYSISNPNRLASGNVFLNDPCTPGTDLGDQGNCTSRLQNSQVTNINRRGNGGISNYNALNTRFEIRNFKRFGLQMALNYTWSHAIDNLSSTFSESSNNVNLGFLDPFNPNLDRGNADFDVRHRLAVSAIWQIPAYRNRRDFKGLLLGGWEVVPIWTARTGSPFSLFDWSNALQVCPRAFFDGVPPTTGVTDQPAPGVPNNFVYYQLTERFRLQLRGEAYNIFNHANYSVSFGDNDVSSIDFVSGHRFGNRNMQLAAKLIF